MNNDPNSPYFGVVKVKSVVKRNDVIVGKILTRVSKDGTRTEIDHSTTVSGSEE